MAIVKLCCFVALVLVWALRPAAALPDGLGTAFMTGGDARSGPVQPSAAQDGSAQGTTLCVRGKLTAEGVECQALRAEDGTLYTLVGDLEAFRVGDEVCVCGALPEVSFCMQGVTIAVMQIDAPCTCPWCESCPANQGAS